MFVDVSVDEFQTNPEYDATVWVSCVAAIHEQIQIAPDFL